MFDPGVLDGPTRPERRSSAILRRLWWLRPILTWFVSVVVFAVVSFFLVRLIPGDPVTIASGGRLSDSEYDSIRADLGLDRPVPVQLWDYLGQLARLDLGTSISTSRPVAEDLASRLPATLELVLTGLLLAFVAACLLSWLVVDRPTSRVSKVLLGYARSAGALPEYVVGVLFLFVFYATLHWAIAPNGRLSPVLSEPETVTGFPVLDALIAGDAAAFTDYVDHLLLPVAVLVVAHTALIMKTLVPALGDAVDAPATRFRVASGAPPAAVVLSVYRRALPPVVVMVGMMFGLFLCGAVVLESLFGLGGLGQYAIDAVSTADVFALRSFLVVVAAICLAVYLLVDLVNGWIDPRRRTGIQGAS